jgi:hypothetical protein
MRTQEVKIKKISMARTLLVGGFAFVLLTGTVFAQAPKLKDVKIRGYVTEFRSLTDFDIEDYRISRDDVFALEFDNPSPDITFGLNDIRVGVELEIRGRWDETTGELKAQSMRVDFERHQPVVIRAP